MPASANACPRTRAFEIRSHETRIKATPYADDDVVGSKETEGGQRSMADVRAQPRPEQGQLLVVDDEPFLRDAGASSLRFLGFDVTTADTGAGAQRLALDGRFDLVVLDVM